MTGALCKLPNKKTGLSGSMIHLCISFHIYIYTYTLKQPPFSGAHGCIKHDQLRLSQGTMWLSTLEVCSPNTQPIWRIYAIYIVRAWWYKLRVRLQGYPDVPFETCHITRVHDLLILYVGSKSFAEPTAFHHLDEPQGWGNFRHPLSGTNSRQRTLRWSHSMGSFKGFQCNI